MTLPDVTPSTGGMTDAELDVIAARNNPNEQHANKYLVECFRDNQRLIAEIRRSRSLSGDPTYAEIEKAVRPSIVESMVELVDGVLPFIEYAPDRNVFRKYQGRATEVCRQRTGGKAVNTEQLACAWCPAPIERDEMDSYWRHRYPNGTTWCFCSVAGHVAEPARQGVKP